MPTSYEVRHATQPPPRHRRQHRRGHSLAAAGCGSDGSADAGGDGRPTLVVTTSVLGDVVEELVGDEAEVDVVMPAGADPHEFQPSARQAVDIREADLLVTNGGGFEAGLDDTIAGAEDDGVTVFTALDHVARST